MTITVIEDIATGSSFSLTRQGPAGTRAFIVQTTDNETMMDIMQDANIPVYNSVYPGSGPPSLYAYMFADTIECAPIQGDPGSYLVTVNYVYEPAADNLGSDDPDACTIQVGTSLSASKTSFDKDDVKLTVTLTGQPDQVGEVDIQVPETVIMFERKENTSPLAKSTGYTGLVNSGAIGSYGMRTLLCLGIDGTSPDGGLSWLVTYRFQYRPDTWDATIVYIDPETDRPHPDIDLATLDGVIVEEIYQPGDFSTLDLPW